MTDRDHRYRLTTGQKTLFCWAADKIAAREKFLREFGCASETCELLD